VLALAGCILALEPEPERITPDDPTYHATCVFYVAEGTDVKRFMLENPRARRAMELCAGIEVYEVVYGPSA